MRHVITVLSFFAVMVTWFYGALSLSKALWRAMGGIKFGLGDWLAAGLARACGSALLAHNCLAYQTIERGRQRVPTKGGKVFGRSRGKKNPIHISASIKKDADPCRLSFSQGDNMHPFFAVLLFFVGFLFGAGYVLHTQKMDRHKKFEESEDERGKRRSPGFFRQDSARQRRTRRTMTDTLLPRMLGVFLGIAFVVVASSGTWYGAVRPWDGPTRHH